MAVAIPNSIKHILNRGYSITDQSRVRRDDVQAGPPRFVKITDTGPSFINVSWSLDGFQFQVFENWKKYDLDEGSLSFNLDIKVGAGYLSHECYFSNGIYDASTDGRRWIVNANLIVLEKQVNTSSEWIELQALDTYFPDGYSGEFVYDLNDFATQLQSLSAWTANLPVGSWR